MIIKGQEFHINGLTYTVRSAVQTDAEQLSEIRVQIDGETENMDREEGEGFIDTKGFQEIIKTDSKKTRNLFLVAEVHNRVVGFSRCEGSDLKRLSHKVEFGVCILKEFWGYGIGKNLLQQSINWADENEVKKISLQVLETNEKAIKLYKKSGFDVEGVLKNDKRLSDGKFYNTVVMGRCIETVHKRGMFYRRKYYIVKNEFIEIFNDHFNNTNLPNQLKHGSRLIGRWMKNQNDGTTEVFAIWEYDRYEDYIEIETKIKNDKMHVKRIHDWYEKHGGKEYVLREYIVAMKNEELLCTVKC